MQLIPIQVQSFANIQEEEMPDRFYYQDHWIEIEEIVDRWYQGNEDPEWPMANYFKVYSVNGCHYLLKHDRESDLWYLVHRW